MADKTKRLELTDPFPFGIHKGTLMAQVPATYLDFIRGEPWITKWPAVLEFIDRRRVIIDEQLRRQGKI